MARSFWLRRLFVSKPPAPHHRRVERRRCRPVLEVLEDRQAPATLTVNSIADNASADNPLTLREAVLLVNNGGNAPAALGRSLTSGEQAQIAGTFGSTDTIVFDPGLAGQTVNLTTVGDSSAGPSALAVSAPLTIQSLTGGS